MKKIISMTFARVYFRLEEDDALRLRRVMCGRSMTFRRGIKCFGALPQLPGRSPVKQKYSFPVWHSRHRTSDGGAGAEPSASSSDQFLLKVYSPDGSVCLSVVI